MFRLSKTAKIMISVAVIALVACKLMNFDIARHLTEFFKISSTFFNHKVKDFVEGFTLIVFT